MSGTNSNNEAEITLLLKAVEEEVFKFIIVRHNHLSWVKEIADRLHAAHPDRKLSRVKLPLGYREGIPYKVVEQESGFLLVDNFEKILEDDSARVNFNQRRDLISSYPIALIVFAPDSVEVMRQLQKGLKDFWSIRNLEIELRREAMGQLGIPMKQSYVVSQTLFSEEVRLALIGWNTGRIEDLKNDPSTKSYRADLAFSLGETHHIKGDFLDARYWLQLALDLYSDVSDLRGKAKALDHIGQSYLVFEELDVAKDLFESALKIQREVSDLPGELFSRNCIAQVLLINEGYEDTIRELQIAQGIAEEIRDEWYLGAIYNNIGLAYFRLGDLSHSQFYFHESQQVWQGSDPSLKESQLVWKTRPSSQGLASLAINLAQLELALGNLEECGDWLTMSIEMNQAQGGKYQEAIARYDYGCYLAMIGNSDGAVQYLKGGVDLFAKMGVLDTILTPKARESIQSTLGPARYQEIIDSLAAEDKP